MNWSKDLCHSTVIVIGFNVFTFSSSLCHLQKYWYLMCLHSLTNAELPVVDKLLYSSKVFAMMLISRESQHFGSWFSHCSGCNVLYPLCLHCCSTWDKVNMISRFEDVSQSLLPLPSVYFGLEFKVKVNNLLQSKQPLKVGRDHYQNPQEFNFVRNIVLAETLLRNVCYFL